MSYGISGKHLKAAREALHLTQGEFAVLLGLTDDRDSKAAKGTISRYEHEKHQPASDLLDRMSEVLGVSADYLLGRTENPQGIITEDGLPPDEVEMLHAYRQGQVGKAADLTSKKNIKSPNNKFSKS